MAFFLTGKDTVTLTQGSASRTLADYPNANIAVVNIPNDSSNTLVGKDGNGIIAFSAEGGMGEIDLRILTGSSDDKYMNAILASYINNPTGFVVLSGTFVKTLGDGNGNLTRKTYSFSGGVIAKLPDSVYNISGDTEQAISGYKIRFVKSTINFN